MSNPIFDEQESTESLGRGQLWIAAICIALSALCCALWLVMLISPRVFR